MKLKINIFFLSIICLACFRCTTKKEEITFMNDSLVVRINQFIYKDSVAKEITNQLQDVEVVWQPKSINGNFAIITKEKKKGNYCIVIRGSMIAFTNDGFHNWIMQDFNIFSMKPWKFTDSIQNAYVSNGSMLGFQNLLLLKDMQSGETIQDFVQKNSNEKSFTISGHSLGGNLAQLLSSYLVQQANANHRTLFNLITFGATAAGNESFVKDLESKFPNGKRYVIDQDIAPIFPSSEAITKASKIMRLDSTLNLPSLNINGVKANITDALGILGSLIGATNYTQSLLHLKPLVLANVKDTIPNDTIENAFLYHKIDSYAECIK